MRTIGFTERNRSGDLLHVETPLGIVNIRIGLSDAEGRRVESIEVIPNDYAGEPRVDVDGYRNTRLVEVGDGRIGDRPMPLDRLGIADYDRGVAVIVDSVRLAELERIAGVRA